MTEKKISQKSTFSGRFDRVERLTCHFPVAQSRSSDRGMGGSHVEVIFGKMKGEGERDGDDVLEEERDFWE
ncbi:hypothetical protein H5410_062681 [Solanum commersonii]|uniref:Uncharacterized protein n=1 Tax=Solanum commersonii TaxID=4109 RepID=A0A9J5WB21_SOLCO|nr:hypothetical protein H5410_062681 [Solanum commersonii]